MAVSVDGFIAREDGAVDWLPQDAGGGEDYGYAAFFESIDVLIMGRKTYELVLTFDQWPYGSTRVIVLSSRPLPAPRHGVKIEVRRGAPREIVAGLEAEGAQRAYVDGGETIRRFIVEGLMDRLILTRVPVLIGRGVPLFGDLNGDVTLRHLATRTYPAGLVQSEYTVRPAPLREGTTAPLREEK